MYSAQAKGRTPKNRCAAKKSRDLMTEKDIREDLPMIMASVMYSVPSLVLRTGWAYLRMKKRAQRASKSIEREFVSGGIPPEYAEKLAAQYAKDLSIRKMMREMDISFFDAARMQQLEK